MMEEPQGEASHENLDNHKTPPSRDFPIVTHNQNLPAAAAAEAEKQDVDGRDPGLGSEDGRTEAFDTDRGLVENPSAEESDQLKDDGAFDCYDDEEAERVISDELRELVLSQAVSEQRSVINGEEDGENADWRLCEGEGVEKGYLENGSKSENWRQEGKYNVRKVPYPLRPDAEDCAFYMKTGSCKFGIHCKFNHPPVPRRRYQSPKDRLKPREEPFERPGQTECKYYLTSGGCKYGNSCKYNHTRERSPIAPIPEFNFLGLPIRPGEKECPYYMRNGSCKYGSNCRFHHPDPTAAVGTDPSSGYGNGGSLQGDPRSPLTSWSSPRALGDTASFVPLFFPATQGVHSSTDWNGYQAPVYPSTERSLPTPPSFTLNNLGAETSFHSRQYQPMAEEEFPERPGQPECSYFLKTGDCKYKLNCKFHHPKSRLMKSTSCALSDKGLPLRPDQAICSFYNRYGICKFGPACKFDHPEHLGNSSPSSVSDFEQPPFSSFATSDGARMSRKGNEGGSLIQQPV